MLECLVLFTVMIWILPSVSIKSIVAHYTDEVNGLLVYTLSEKLRGLDSGPLVCNGFTRTIIFHLRHE